MKWWKHFLAGIAIVLIIAATLFWWYRDTGERKSIQLSQRVPESSFMMRVDAFELSKLLISTGPVEVDSFNNPWAHLMRPPQDMGLDLFTDPWLFGDDQSINLAFRLSHPDKFEHYVRTVLVPELHLTIEETDHFAVGYEADRKFAVSWNKEGHALIQWYFTPYEEEPDFRSFYIRTDTTHHDWVEQGVLSQVVIEDRNIPYWMQWMGNNVYDLTLDKEMLRLGDNGDSVTSVPVHISIYKSPELTRRVIKALPFQDLIEELNMDPEFLADQRGIQFDLHGSSEEREKYITYEYDDDFNMMPVEHFKTKTRLSWSADIKFWEHSTMDSLIAGWKKKSLLNGNILHLKEIDVKITTSGNRLTFSSSDQIGTPDTTTSLLSNVALLEYTFDTCGIKIPEKYSFPVKAISHVQWTKNGGEVEFAPGYEPALKTMVRLAAWYRRLKLVNFNQQEE